MQAEILASKLIIFIFSVVIHEVMHGVVALKYGDRTALNAGRLTLNPLPHIDPLGTIVMPLLLFLAHLPPLGSAKPVPVNPLNFTNIRQGELAVSAAGILSNFTLALLGVLLFHLLNFNLLTAELFSFLFTINLILGVFNLIPIPPLDGSKIVMSQLSYQQAQSYMQLERFGLIIIVILLYFGIIGQVAQPILTFLSSISNVPLNLF